jgi:hypothetical protein
MKAKHSKPIADPDWQPPNRGMKWRPGNGTGIRSVGAMSPLYNMLMVQKGPGCELAANCRVVVPYIVIYCDQTISENLQ